MALPRHLQGRFNATDGNPLDSDKPGHNATASDTGADPDDDNDPADAGAEAAGGSGGDDNDAGSQRDSGADASQNPVADTGVDDDGSAASGDGKKDANYARMEGRYKAQIRRLEERITDLSEQARGATTLTDLLVQTREELANVRAAAAPAAAATASTAADANDLTEDEAALFGDFAPVAQKLIARATAPLQQEIAELRAQAGDVDNRVGQTSEALFIGNVRSQVQGFDTIRNDPDWADFLRRPVPFTTHSVGTALEEAHNARDLDRVVSIFNAFTSERGPADAGASDTAADGAQAANQQAKPKPGLEQFATPDRTAANPSGKPKAQFRESDYRKNLSDMRAGRISKEQFMKFENDFFEAKRAGRVSQ